MRNFLNKALALAAIVGGSLPSPLAQVEHAMRALKASRRRSQARFKQSPVKSRLFNGRKSAPNAVKSRRDAAKRAANKKAKR